MDLFDALVPLLVPDEAAVVLSGQVLLTEGKAALWVPLNIFEFLTAVVADLQLRY